jgi:hypothetical protein
MKLIFAKQAYDKLNAKSQAELKPIPCDCISKGVAQSDCESCDGGGVLYEAQVSPEDAAAIAENLRRQGVPIGEDDGI